MVKNDNKTIKIVGAVATGIGLVAAGIAGGFALDNPEPVVKYKNVTVTETEYVEVPVEVEKIVEVDNGNLDMVTEYLEENFEDDYLVFEDADEIVEKIEMEDSYKEKAIDMFKEEYKDYVVAPSGFVLSDSSIEKIRDEKVKAIDYDDKEFVVSFETEIEFEDDDEKVTKLYEVTYDFDLDVDDNEDVEVSVIEK